MSTAPDVDADAAPAFRAKPPFLRRVRIRGYKSIAFCDVTLEPLTILVGRNASGKSNFLDALAFLRELMDMRAADAVTARNGWSSICCRHGSTPEIEMSLEASFPSGKVVWDAAYSFALTSTDGYHIRIQREKLILTEQGRNRRCGYRVEDGQTKWIGTEHFAVDPNWTEENTNPYTQSEDKVEPPRVLTRRRHERLLLGDLDTDPFIELAERLRFSGVYNFSPPAIRTLRLKTADPQLTHDGGNLASVIGWLRENEPETADRVVTYLSAIVSEIQNVETIRYGEYETLQFKLTSPGRILTHLLPASSMSDGTLRVLAALAASYQVLLPTIYPTFVAIEEPETSLHPAAMRALVAALDEATLRTQVLITTHSADLLDNPTIRPENVRVVEMIDGATAITPVDEASVSIVRDRLSTLGGLERDRQLQLDPDDLDRQAALARQERAAP